MKNKWLILVLTALAIQAKAGSVTETNDYNFMGKVAVAQVSGTNIPAYFTVPLYTPMFGGQTVALNLNGQKQVAGTFGASIWTSSDYGSSWAEQTNAGSHNWQWAAMSDDGTKIAIVVAGGRIWTSVDSGVNWTEQLGSQSGSWNSLACSSDGSKLVACQFGGTIWTSTDFGTNWTQRSDTNYWWGVCSSADGTKLAASVSDMNGKIWTSTDSGVTWTSQAGSQGSVYGISCSADGSKLAAAQFDGYIWISTNYGTNWTPRASNAKWLVISESSDGTKLVAVVQNYSPPSYLWTSIDSGLTWVPQSSVGSKLWYGTGMSKDGNRLAGIEDNVWDGYLVPPSTAGINVIGDVMQSGWHYWFGDANTDNSWRQGYVAGTSNVVIQVRENGVWTNSTVFARP